MGMIAVDTFGPSSYAWLEFDERGALADPAASSALDSLLAKEGVTDLVVMSHGWKNDRNDATKLYGTLWRNVVSALKNRDAAGVVVAGVLWPAKTYSTDLDDAAARAAEAGTREVGSAPPSRDLDDGEFDARLEEFQAVFGARADGVMGAARRAASNVAFASSRDLIAVGRAASGADPTQIDDPELSRDASLFDSPHSPDDLLRGLMPPPPPSRMVAASGGTRALGGGEATPFSGPRAAVARFLNQLTYFEMKRRAGVVGSSLGSTVLPALPSLAGKRLHLVGHSFGARLVTAATAAIPAPETFEISSLSLLQGAYSHNGLAAAAGGAFAAVVGRVKGPIAVTHTRNDRACSFWYPLASRFSRDTTSEFGDKDDPFGAMGANGAQKLAVSSIAPENTGPPFAPIRNKVNGFAADAYVLDLVDEDGSIVVDAHNNVANETCGELVAAVIEA